MSTARQNYKLPGVTEPPKGRAINILSSIPGSCPWQGMMGRTPTVHVVRPAPGSLQGKGHT